MTQPFDAFGLWRTGLQGLHILAEAQTVIALRMMGMFGFWSVTPQENARMVSEKTDAFTRAAFASAQVLARGGSPIAAAEAAMLPVRRKTRSNARRLAKRGPKRR